MFNNVVMYRFCKPLALSPVSLNQALYENRFTSPQPTQASSAGFVPPLPAVDGGAAPYLHQADGRWVLCLKVATRNVKPAELMARINDKVAAIEQREHRKVFRKEKQNIKDEVLLELLPQAFPEERTARACITPRSGLLAVEAGSHNAAEFFLGQLRQALEGLPVALPRVVQDPGLAMLAWLNAAALDDAQDTPLATLPQGLALGEFAELKSRSHGGRVTLNDEDPADDNAAGYRAANYAVTALALATCDDMAGIRFRLTSELLLKGIKSDYEVDIGEGIDHDDVAAQRAALFDAELVLFFGVLEQVWGQLVTAFGGYADDGVPAAWPATYVELAPVAADEFLSGNETDPLYPEALKLVLGQEWVSITRLQRQLRIGYNRAARLVETLEAAGIVRPLDEAGERVVNVEVVTHAAV